MKKHYLILILFLLVSAVYSQNSKNDYSEAFELIEVWLEAQKDYNRLPGISAIVVEDQEVLWSGSFGLANKENNIKAEPSTLYSICSISKLFTAVAIMKLYDEGKLRLDDQINDLLPWYNLEQKFPESGLITIRSILTHSSGLPREANFPYWTGPDFPFPTSAQIKDELGKQETLYPASTYFQYSNLGLTLLGEIVEEVSGIPYHDYIKQNILDPLELTNTRTELPEPLYGNKLAVGYSSITRDGNREKVNLFQANGIKSAAGFSSNVLDLGKFASWQFRLMNQPKTEILKPSTLKYMHNVHWTDPDWEITWGLGFIVDKAKDGSKWILHGGHCPGYSSIIQLNPKSKRAYSVMINANRTNPREYANNIHEILKKADEQIKDGKEVEKFKKDKKEYVGYYSSMPWRSEVYVTFLGGNLVILDLPTDSPAESLTFFKYINDDTFRRIRDDKKLGETLVFERDNNGKIIRYKRHGNYSVKIVR